MWRREVDEKENRQHNGYGESENGYDDGYDGGYDGDGGRNDEPDMCMKELYSTSNAGYHQEGH